MNEIIVKNRRSEVERLTIISFKWFLAYKILKRASFFFTFTNKLYAEGVICIANVYDLICCCFFAYPVF